MCDFGVIEEPTSRVFWESEEEIRQSEAPSLFFKQEWSELQAPSRFKTLVVAVGCIDTALSAGSGSRVGEWMCRIHSECRNNVAELVRLEEDMYILFVSQTIDLKHSGLFVENISDIISKSEKIFIFTNERKSRLLGKDRDEEVPTLWRSLSTAKALELGLSKVTRLHTPNFIVGIAAGIVSYAEAMELPAVAYILYVSSDVLVKERTGATMKLFTEVTKCTLSTKDEKSNAFDNSEMDLYI